MKLKSYFAATVEAAMNMARLEMGVDAMLVSTRRTDEQSRHLGDYEVVFASVFSNDAKTLATSLAGGAQRFGSRRPRLRIQAAVYKHIGLVQEDRFGGLGHDVVNVFRAFHHRMDIDLIAADLPRDIGVVGGGGDDF